MEEATQEVLGKLAKKLFDAKRAEDEAKKERIEAEEEIAALVETGANGSLTVDTGTGIKVTVKRSLGYVADVAAIREMDIAEEVMPVKQTDPVPAGFKFDEKAYERILVDHPDVAAQLAQHITTKPRKVSVTMKLG